MKFDKALVYHEKAYETWVTVLGISDKKTAIATHNLGVLYQTIGEYDKALNYQKKH